MEIKNNVCVMSLYLLLVTFTMYCPVKKSPFDSMRSFLFQNIQRPSVADWQSMTQEQKDDWWHLYETNPSLFMTNNQKQEYIIILERISQSLPPLPFQGGPFTLLEERRAEIIELHEEVVRRINLAYTSLEF